MKIIVAPDSFKGTLSAHEASRAIAGALTEELPIDTEIIKCPIADGGEGTLDALTSPNEQVSVWVTGADGEKTRAKYGKHGGRVIIEMAQAAGISPIPSMRHAATATTYGVGEMMCHALDHGAEKILLTLGGSATNDGGAGMAAALGMVFFDAAKNSFVPTGETLGNIESIDISHMHPGLSRCEISVATDVTNPLLGQRGATMVYAPQKGATAAELECMEAGMKKYSGIIEKICGFCVSQMPGAGAAGGCAVPLLAFAGARIESGIGSVLDAVDFFSKLKGCDAVITGEGRIDGQSVFGKAVSGVLDAALNKGVRVLCICGCKGDGWEKMIDAGAKSIYAMADMFDTEVCISDAFECLRRTTIRLAKNELR